MVKVSPSVMVDQPQSWYPTSVMVATLVAPVTLRGHLNDLRPLGAIRCWEAWVFVAIFSVVFDGEDGAVWEHWTLRDASDGDGC